MAFFSHLDDNELLQLFNNSFSTLTREDLNNINFNFNTSLDDTDSNGTDGGNTCLNISLPITRYYDYEDFGKLLSSKPCPTIL